MPVYRRRKVKENPERDIVLGLITNTEFIREINDVFSTEYIETPFILTVSKWCLDYYAKFGTAPNVHIEDIYKEEVRAGRIDEDQESLISDLLGGLSEEYERSSSFNTDFLVDKAVAYFESRNLLQHVNRVKRDIQNGEIKAASSSVEEYKAISIESSGGVDPFTDSSAIQSAFETAIDPLFKLPGEAGKFLNDLFTRDSFVTLLGPEKRGKTWCMIELALAARKGGNDVAFFSAGDMTENQMILRFGTALTGRNPRKKYCGKILIPVLDCLKNQNDSCTMSERAGSYPVLVPDGKNGFKYLAFKDAEDHSPCTFCLRHPRYHDEWQGSSWFKYREPVPILDERAILESGRKFNRRYGTKHKIMLKAYKNGSLTVSEIRKQLYRWKTKLGFKPSVIVTDYMDLLVGKKSDQFRHSINDIWAETRGLSQEENALVISASQSDAESYYAKWITMKNFSEDKRKFSHVTGMISLNQLQEEKSRGVMRLGQLAVREDELDEKKYVTILQSLARGKFISASW